MNVIESRRSWYLWITYFERNVAKQPLAQKKFFVLYSSDFSVLKIILVTVTFLFLGNCASVAYFMDVLHSPLGLFPREVTESVEFCPASLSPLSRQLQHAAPVQIVILISLCEPNLCTELSGHWQNVTDHIKTL